MKHKRLFFAGLLAVVLAAAFFVYMQGQARASNDPVAMMRTVGQVCGVAGGIGLAMIICSFFLNPPGRRRRR